MWISKTLYCCVFLQLTSIIGSISGLQITSIPPLIDVPTYSLATQDVNGKTGMNILTYATPVSIRPDRIWSIGLYKGTVAHENFSATGNGVLQLLMPCHADAVRVLGGSSGRDIDKRQECEKLGLPWFIPSNVNGDDDHDDKDDNVGDFMPELLPGCACYLRLTLVGELIDCGSHDVALCKVDSMLIEDGHDAPAKDYLNTASLRDMGIITEQGRIAD